MTRPRSLTTATLGRIALCLGAGALLLVVARHQAGAVAATPVGALIALLLRALPFASSETRTLLGAALAVAGAAWLVLGSSWGERTGEGAAISITGRGATVIALPVLVAGTGAPLPAALAVLPVIAVIRIVAAVAARDRRASGRAFLVAIGALLALAVPPDPGVVGPLPGV